MTVKDLIDWLNQFSKEADCDIKDKIIVTDVYDAKYIFTNEGDET